MAEILRVVSPATVLTICGWVLWSAAEPVSSPADTRADTDVSLVESRQLAQEVESLHRDGRIVDALGPLTRLRQAYPHNVIYIFRLAEAYRAATQYGDAAEMLELYLDRAPVPWAACPIVGDDFWKAGRPTEALAAYRRCHELEPSNPDHVLALGLAYERLGQLDEAAAQFAAGLRMAPDYADFGIAQARLLIRTGYADDAERLVRGLLEEQPDLPDGLFVLGLALEHQGQLDAARTAYEHARELVPDGPGILVALARLQLWGGQAKDAYDLASQVIAQHPSDVDAKLVAALALERQNRLDRARALAEEVLRTSPSYGDVYVLLGRIAESQGRPAEALQLYARLLELEPDRVEAKRGLRRIRGGAS